MAVMTHADVAIIYISVYFRYVSLCTYTYTYYANCTYYYYYNISMCHQSLIKKLYMNPKSTIYIYATIAKVIKA